MGRKFSLTDFVIFLLIAVIGAAEGAHLYAVLLHRSFSRCVLVFIAAAVTFLALLCGYFFWCRKREGAAGKSDRAKFSRKEKILLLLFGALALSQILFVATGTWVYLQGDMTVETVGSFLETDAVYSVNPMTGAAYQGGIPMRLKVLCLPTLYGVMSRITGIRPEYLVWQIIPVFTLLFAYAAYSSLAGSLFPEEREKRLLFLVLVAVLIWIGSYRYGMDGFGILYSGWRGVTLRNMILIPYALSLCLRKRYFPALACLAAEVCIVWTLYGLGAGLIAAAGVTLTDVLYRRLGAGREAEND